MKQKFISASTRYFKDWQIPFILPTSMQIANFSIPLFNIIHKISHIITLHHTIHGFKLAPCRSKTKAERLGYQDLAPTSCSLWTLLLLLFHGLRHFTLTHTFHFHSYSYNHISLSLAHVYFQLSKFLGLRILP